MKPPVIIGIDQSLSSTGVCIYRPGVRSGAPCTYYNIVASNKLTKKMTQFQHPFLTIIPYERLEGTEYESKELAKTRNIQAICQQIRDLIRKHRPGVLVLEGISYGSVGSASLVDLAGLNFCIRNLALEMGLEVRIASPMTVKKQATGNGGATKDEMIWAWKNCDPNINDLSGIKMDDIADAYFLARVYEHDYINKPLTNHESKL